MDGLPAGHPSYEADQAAGAFSLDTLKYADGWHVLSWSVKDTTGAAADIGARYFNVQNGAGAAIPEAGLTPVFAKRGFSDEPMAEAIYPDADGSIRIRITQASRLAVYLNQEQSFEGEAELVARAERILGENKKGGDRSLALSPNCSRYEAYALVGQELRPLPIGASFDSRDGILYWQPGPGFLGEHQIVLVDKATGIRKTIKITIS